MGKVLLEFDLDRLGRAMIDRTGLGREVIQKAFTDNDLPRQYESGAIGDHEFYRKIVSRLNCAMSWNEFVRAWNSIFHPVPILSDDLIERLAERSDLWVVSNTNKLHFDHILETYGFLRHFRGYVLSHEVGALKPDRRIFEEALRRAAAPIEEVLFVDDQVANVEAAQALGIAAFRFLGAKHFESEMGTRSLL